MCSLAKQHFAGDLLKPSRADKAGAASSSDADDLLQSPFYMTGQEGMAEEAAWSAGSMAKAARVSAKGIDVRGSRHGVRRGHHRSSGDGDDEEVDEEEEEKEKEQEEEEFGLAQGTGKPTVENGENLDPYNVACLQIWLQELRSVNFPKWFGMANPVK
eukprot:Skav215010  [mRNA]  locus=scaffold966:16748:19598:+ [translate_table: standard]